jgi:hypothetical protein
MMEENCDEVLMTKRETVIMNVPVSGLKLP